MPKPEYNRIAARPVIHVLERAGFEINATVQGDEVVVQATDADGQVYRHQRDDGDLLGALCEIAVRCGVKL